MEYISSVAKLSEWKTPAYGKKAKEDDKKKDKANNKKIIFHSQLKDNEVSDWTKKGTTLGTATNLVRTLATTPGNYLNPGQYQELIQTRAQKNRYIYRFFDYDKLKKMKTTKKLKWPCKKHKFSFFFPMQLT